MIEMQKFFVVIRWQTTSEDISLAVLSMDSGTYKGDLGNS